MRYFYLGLIASMLASHGGLRAAELEGTWFSCNPELETPSPWNVLDIERDGKIYKWQHGWGQHYSAEGTVSIRGKNLILYGCNAYNGEQDADCDEKNPPVILEIERKELNRKFKSVDVELMGSGWIRVGKFTLKELFQRCEELRDENISQRNSKSKK